MSLFRIKQLVTQSIDYLNTFDSDNGSLCVFKPDVENDILYIALSLGDDILHIYDFSNLKCENVNESKNKLLELRLSHSIMHIISGYFVKSDSNEQLAILHEKSLTVLKLNTNRNILKVQYCFDFPTSTFSICSRENETSDCDVIFVQTVDSNLFCLREDNCLFSILLFNVLLPSLICYINSTESIVFSGSDHCLRSYRYQILSSSSSKKMYEKNPKLKSSNVSVKCIPPSWSVVVNEPLFLLDKYEAKNCTFIIVIGRCSVFIITEKGEIYLSRKLNCTPTHLSVFVTCEDSNLEPIPKFIVATKESYLLVFHKTEIKWCVKTDATVSALTLPKNTRGRSALKFGPDLPLGMLPILFSNSSFALCYLGSYPSTGPLTTQHKVSNHELNCNMFKQKSDLIKDLLAKGSIPVLTKLQKTGDTPQVKTLMFQNLIDFGCKIQLDINFPNDLVIRNNDNAKVYIDHDTYFKPTKRVYTWDMGKMLTPKKNKKQSLLVTFKCNLSLDESNSYINPKVKFNLSYPQNIDNVLTNQHCSISTTLPLHLYYTGVSVSKTEAKGSQNIYRITLKVDKYDELNHLYPEFNLSKCNAIEFSPKTLDLAKTKTVVMSRTDLSMYRIQGDDFECLFSILQDLLQKFSKHKVTPSITSLKGTDKNDLVNEFMKQMEPFFKMLHENFLFFTEVELKLTAITKSVATFYQYMISMQKQFITKLKMRMPCEVSSYHYLLDSSLVDLRNLSIEGQEYAEALKGCYISIKLNILLILNILISAMKVDKEKFDILVNYLDDQYDSLIVSKLMHVMEVGYKQAKAFEEGENPLISSNQIITGPLELLHYHIKLCLMHLTEKEKPVELLTYFESHHSSEILSMLVELCTNVIMKSNDIEVSAEDIENINKKLLDEPSDIRRSSVSPFLRAGDEDSPPKYEKKQQYTAKQLLSENEYHL